MSMVHQCDRCGDVFDKEPKLPKVEKKRAAPGLTTGMEFDLQMLWPNQSKVDLCRQCIIDFEQYWNTYITRKGGE